MLVSPQISSPMAFTGLGGIGAWKALTRNLDQRLEKFAKEPAIAREISYFRDKIGSIGTAEALVKDQRLYEFAVQAYDLEGQENAQGLMKRVLASDLSDSRSPANRMSDEKYRAITRDFNFAGGTSGDQAKLDKVVKAYLRATLEARTGSKLPTVTTDEQDTQLADLGKETAVAAEIAYFRQAMTQVDSSAEVADDSRLVAFGLRAAGFATKTSYSADFIEKALDDETVREGLGDERWDKFAGFFADARAGRKLRGSGIDAKVDAVVDRWVKASFALETGRQVSGTVSAPLEQELATFAARTDIKEKTDAFRKQIAGVTSSSGLAANVSAYNFVMRAFGLEDYKRNVDMVFRTLNEPVTSRTSPASQDKRFKDMAEGLAFLGKSSLPATSDAAFVDAVVEKYVRVQFERAVGGNDINLRHALYAQRRLPEITSAYQITGDTALRSFVFPSVGLSPDSAQDVDRLANLVKQKVDLGKLKDTAYLDKLSRRFFAVNAGTSSSGVAASGSAALALLGGATDSGFSLDLLVQMQSRR
jgi:hypothetical protein